MVKRGKSVDINLPRLDNNNQFKRDVMDKAIKKESNKIKVSSLDDEGYKLNKKTSSKKSKIAADFNNFKQNEIDFDKMEKEILSNN